MKDTTKKSYNVPKVESFSCRIEMGYANSTVNAGEEPTQTGTTALENQQAWQYN